MINWGYITTTCTVTVSGSYSLIRLSSDLAESRRCLAFSFSFCFYPFLDVGLPNFFTFRSIFCNLLLICACQFVHLSREADLSCVVSSSWSFWSVAVNICLTYLHFRDAILRMTSTIFVCWIHWFVLLSLSRIPNILVSSPYESMGKAHVFIV